MNVVVIWHYRNKEKQNWCKTSPAACYTWQRTISDNVKFVFSSYVHEFNLWKILLCARNVDLNILPYTRFQFSWNYLCLPDVKGWAIMRLTKPRKWRTAHKKIKCLNAWAFVRKFYVTLCLLNGLCALLKQTNTDKQVIWPRAHTSPKYAKLALPFWLLSVSTSLIFNRLSGGMGRKYTGSASHPDTSQQERLLLP